MLSPNIILMLQVLYKTAELLDVEEIWKYNYSTRYPHRYIFAISLIRKIPFILFDVSRRMIFLLF